MENSDILKIIISSVLSFVIGMVITPYVSLVLYKYKLWKKKSVSIATDGANATLTTKLHNDEERKVPRMGGVIVWQSVIIVSLFLYILHILFPNHLFGELIFLNRNQTIIPFAVLVGMSLIGLIDDYLVCQESHKKQGLSVKLRLAIVGLSGLLISLWFYFKIDITYIHLPFIGNISTPFVLLAFLFIFAIIGTYAGGVIDGIDGLAGGVFAIMFAGYGVVSFSLGYFDIAALCLAITGGLCAFLWFNIPPARFFLSDTGTMGLTTTLATIAFFTNTLFILPIIGLPLVVTVLSDIIQLVSKKMRNGKKVFLVAPLHNHFQILGWPPYKVTMRYWVLTIMCTFCGVILVLLDKTY